METPQAKSWSRRTACARSNRCLALGVSTTYGRQGRQSSGVELRLLEKWKSGIGGMPAPWSGYQRRSQAIGSCVDMDETIAVHNNNYNGNLENSQIQGWRWISVKGSPGSVTKWLVTLSIGHSFRRMADTRCNRHAGGCGGGYSITAARPRPWPWLPASTGQSDLHEASLHMARGASSFTLLALLHYQPCADCGP